MSWPASRNVPPHHLPFRAAARVAAERLLPGVNLGEGVSVALLAVQADPWNPTRGTFRALPRVEVLQVLRESLGHPTATAAAEAIAAAQGEHPRRIPIVCALASGEVIVHWIEPRGAS